MTDTDVLVVGAGPVGLTAAAELRRQGVSCRLVDRLPARLPYAKAVGIQPRTMEVWDRMGMVRAALETAVPLHGQLVYVDGAAQGRIDLRLPPEVPYGFAAMPQYETERIIEEHLARFGTRIERGTELLSFVQDGTGVTSRLRTPDGEEELRTRYLVGCDGAHSIVRKSLGLGFEGGAFPEEYMLADVEVDWSMPPGYGVRAIRHDPAGAAGDVLVCIPLPGRNRYRLSMLVAPELSAAAQEAKGAGGAGDGITHGLQADRAPRIEHIQAVLDRLSPEPATATAMRWSSVFRISHRLVDRYGAGRAFVAGDAAHIHPPTGAQGMNTGIQDAVNLAWKLALALDGGGNRNHYGNGNGARGRLLDSYHAERHPVGEEVVGRTVRHARQGVGSDADDATTVLLREAQLLVGYPDSPVVGPGSPGRAGPGPGERAPDCGGLAPGVPAVPLRLYDLLRERGLVLVCYAAASDELAACAELVAAARRSAGDLLAAFVVVAGAGGDGDAGAGDGAEVAYGATDADGAPLAVFRDGRGEFARRYSPEGSTAFLVRPDGYLGTRIEPLTGPAAAGALAAHLGRVLGD
ncbi:FAD-dependent monooxygenase [Streptomyces sp. NPDC093225]|uniref:FAD-dependent monooxygenase n=1 Tax=Streptomyces sp. NPDC093225 TaxID=3366034 RepID=UPI0038097E13